MSSARSIRIEHVVQVEGFPVDPIMTRTFTVTEIINASEVLKVDTVVNIASLYQSRAGSLAVLAAVR